MRFKNTKSACCNRQNLRNRCRSKSACSGLVLNLIGSQPATGQEAEKQDISDVGKKSVNLNV